METKLFEWINENREKGACVGGFAIKQMAQQLFKEIYSMQTNFYQFKASNGWMINFLKRKKIVLRRVTTTGRDLPTNTSNVIKGFFKIC